MKYEEVVAVFWRTAAKNLKKKENEDDFESLDAFDEGKFYRTLRSFALSEAEFYSEG